VEKYPDVAVPVLIDLPSPPTRYTLKLEDLQELVLLFTLVAISLDADCDWLGSGGASVELTTSLETEPLRTEFKVTPESKRLPPMEDSESDTPGKKQLEGTAVTIKISRIDIIFFMIPSRIIFNKN